VIEVVVVKGMKTLASLPSNTFLASIYVFCTTYHMGDVLCGDSFCIKRHFNHHKHLNKTYLSRCYCRNHLHMIDAHVKQMMMRMSHGPIYGLTLDDALRQIFTGDDCLRENEQRLGT
jgi:hypothetical protein